MVICEICGFKGLEYDELGGKMFFRIETYGRVHGKDIFGEIIRCSVCEEEADNKYRSI